MQWCYKECDSKLPWRPCKTCYTPLNTLAADASLDDVLNILTTCKSIQAIDVCVIDQDEVMATISSSCAVWKIRRMDLAEEDEAYWKNFGRPIFFDCSIFYKLVEHDYCY